MRQSRSLMAKATAGDDRNTENPSRPIPFKSHLCILDVSMRYGRLVVSLKKCASFHSTSIDTRGQERDRRRANSWFDFHSSRNTLQNGEYLLSYV